MHLDRLPHARLATGMVQPIFVAVILLLLMPALLVVMLHSVSVHPALAAAPHHVYLPLVAQGGNPPAPGGAGVWSGPIGVSPLDGSIWVVNPDAGSVSIVDPQTLTRTAEMAVGQAPWSLAMAADGEMVYVTDRARGRLVVLDARMRQVRSTIAVGPEPAAVVLSRTMPTAYVSLSTANEIVVVDTSQLTITGRISVLPHPAALAIRQTGQNEHLYVTHLLALPRPGGREASDDGRAGYVTVIAPATHTVDRVIELPPDMHGFPNMMSGIALAGNAAWLPHVRSAPALPNELTTTVFAAVAVLDLTTGGEDRAAHLPLNDQVIFGSPVNNPVAAIPAADGQRLYVVLAGSDLVEVVDITDIHQPRLVKFLPTGKNPRGMVISPDGQRGYVMNYLSRSVTVLDLAGLEAIADVPVTSETLDPVVLRGKMLFNNAAQPRLSQFSWVSCASCHADGGNDGVTWMTPDGPRQTPALWHAAQTPPLHWSATLDELQDVEDTIRFVQHGIGLATGRDPPLLGSPNAGRSADLDALAAFLTRGIRAPVLPPPASDSERGRQLYIAAGCAICHSGPAWTSSARAGPPGSLDLDGNGMVDAVLRDVGTHNALDVRGATGFDVPSLLHVGLTAPYLHDGSMPTLAALLASGHPHPAAGRTTLTDADIAALVTFLQSIGSETVPITSEQWQE